jgi:hypothetical protein
LELDWEGLQVEMVPPAVEEVLGLGRKVGGGVSGLVQKQQQHQQWDGTGVISCRTVAECYPPEWDFGPVAASGNGVAADGGGGGGGGAVTITGSELSDDTVVDVEEGVGRAEWRQQLEEQRVKVAQECKRVEAELEGKVRLLVRRKGRAGAASDGEELGQSSSVSGGGDGEQWQQELGPLAAEGCLVEVMVDFEGKGGDRAANVAAGAAASGADGGGKAAWTTLLVVVPTSYPSVGPSCWFSEAPEGFVVGSVGGGKPKAAELLGSKVQDVVGVISWEELLKRKEAWLEMQAVMAEEPVGNLKGLVAHWVGAVTAAAAP